MRHTASLLLCSVLFSIAASAEPAPGFVSIEAAIPGVLIESRYYSADNFIGEPVDGYEGPGAYLTAAAAEALAAVQQDLEPFGLGLKIFDAYRPQRAVDYFVRWTKNLDDRRMKARYYPRIAKVDLIPDGYIAARSGHSRGSTVDLTIVERRGTTARELDMGTPFDFFGPESHGRSLAVSPQQRANRLLLRSVMEARGFRPLAEEWWHFTLDAEPFPDRYFDFVVE